MSCEIQATVKFERTVNEFILNEQNVRNPAAVLVMKTFFAVYPSEKKLVKRSNLNYQLQVDSVTRHL